MLLDSVAMPPAEPAAPAPRLGVRQLLVLGLWFGLLGGLGEIAMLLVAKVGLHRYLHRSLDVIWQAPLSLALICVGAALLLALAGRWWMPPGVAIGILGFLALLDATPALGQLHPVTRLLLVAGMAVQAARMMARHLESMLRIARRSVVPLLILVAALGAGLRGYFLLAERRATAALPAPDPGAPNVLLLLLDTVRAMDLSLYGYSRGTSPVLEELGRQGTVFDRAYATSSFTLPTHASIFTGRLPFETNVGWHTPLDRTEPTLAEVLAARGYLTAGFSANNYFVTRESGLARGFAHFEDFRASPLSALLGSAVATAMTSPEIRSRFLQSYQLPDRKRASQVNKDLLAWLERVPAGRPFFAFVNYYDAHEPYLPPAPFDTAFTGGRTPWTDRNPLLKLPRPTTPVAAGAERDAYNQAIAYLDHEIGVLLADLERTGRLRNTIIIVTSDHGDEFGEHGLLSHGFSLNPSLLWVPLLVVFPGKVPAGSRIRAPVSLVDLPATIMALASAGRPTVLPGESLFHGTNTMVGPESTSIVAELSYTPGHPGWYPVSRAPLRSLTLGDWHLVVDASGRETLMDISADPAGRRIDRSAPGYVATVAPLRARLDSTSSRRR